MADLNSATLDDVKAWFTGHYGPNNAVLVLAGDVDLATARAKVGEWFGDIPRGPEVQMPKVTVTTLPATFAKQIHDLTNTTRIYRMWALPVLGYPAAVQLMMALGVCGLSTKSPLTHWKVGTGPGRATGST